MAIKMQIYNITPGLLAQIVMIFILIFVENGTGSNPEDNNRFQSHTENPFPRQIISDLN